MGIGAQNTLGGTEFLPKKFVTATEFCPKNFQHIIFGNGIKTSFRLQYLALLEPKVAAQRNCT